MKDKKQRNKGITLISLIVTIVVLLILAGISIGAIMGDNSLVGQASDAKILTQLSKVNEAIELYKIMEQKDSLEEIDNNTLINNKILKEYTIEETLRPIAVIEDYKTLGFKEKFGKGYSNIESYEITGDDILYIATLKELKDVCAIDLTDGTLYYLNDGNIYSISGKTDIANSYNRVNADTAEWTFNKTTKTLTAYNYKDKLTESRGEQQAGEVIVPNYYEGTRVSAIGGSVFKENTDLTKLIISNGIQTIGEYAFYNCTSLSGNLIIPDSVTTIGQRAFYSCTSLDGTLKMSNSLETLGYRAFNDCNKLRGNLIIPQTLTKLGGGAFYKCSSLESITIEDGCAAEIPNASEDNVGVFAYCSGMKGDLIIPDSFGNIGKWAFYQCTGLDGKIKIGSNVKAIERQAFQGCSNLKGDLIIPDSVTTIGERAFYSCTSLDGTLKMSNSVETIGYRAFNDCNKLKGNLIIPQTLTKLGGGAFYKCSSLEGLTIEDGCAAEIPNASEDNVGVFAYCSGMKGDLIIPDSFGNIGKWAFYQCTGLDGKIKIGSNVKTIERQAFNNCKNLKGDLIMPDSVTTIGWSAFAGCSSLDGTLKLSKNLENISYGAFSGCSNLKGKIEISNTVKTIGNMAFGNCSSLEGLTIEEGCTASITGGGWNVPGAFGNCTGLKGEVVIPSTFGAIGDYTFYKCTGLDEIVFKSSNTSIYDSTNTISSNIKIGGYSGSTAEEYATKYNRTFEVIE